MAHGAGAVSDAPVLLLGVMTDPALEVWRGLLREALREPLESSKNRLAVRYVIGNLQSCPPTSLAKLGCSNGNTSALECSRLKQEQRVNFDLWALQHARDCTSHGNPVAEKTFEWYREASVHTSARWIGKFDDDTLPNIWELFRDVQRMESKMVSLQNDKRTGPFAYYGVMGWRVWSRRFRRACFGPVVNTRAGPNGRSQLALYNIKRAMQQAADPTSNRTVISRTKGYCGAGMQNGPYPYADGMLHILSAPLARAVFRTTMADEFASGQWRTGASHPFAESEWHHEDVGIGYLIFAFAVKERAPLAYFALQGEHEHTFGEPRGPHSKLMSAPSRMEIRRRRRHPQNRTEIQCSTTVSHKLFRARLIFDVAHAYRAREKQREIGSSAPFPDMFACTRCDEWKWDRATAGGLQVQPW
eukprot:CAMPEP_0115833186 /NCGR_PEP_ID=MMETSP0287-20121206/3042_1 /TAXON_ID=412157 /ORGANISM="Chrysochromulina rotalis, Strain UIO044" /LENGTH=415 /DNA_ID=CAMNT_0003286591 /DNA_START=107 /DNA_END=1351 /DNA_ORIENTATION=+